MGVSLGDDLTRPWLNQAREMHRRVVLTGLSLVGAEWVQSRGEFGVVGRLTAPAADAEHAVRFETPLLRAIRVVQQQLPCS